MGLLFVFLDGVGLAPANPITRSPARQTPALRGLGSGPLTIEQVRPLRIEDRWRMEGSARFSSIAILYPPEASSSSRPLDATLGVDGLPQSGTGHTALLAGVNAAFAWPAPAALPAGGAAPAAGRAQRLPAPSARQPQPSPTAFGPGYWRALAARRIRKSTSVIAAEGAQLRFRDGHDLRAGQTVAWDVTNAAMRVREPGRRHAAGDTGAGRRKPCGPGARAQPGVLRKLSAPDLAGHGRLEEDQTGRPKTKGQPLPRIATRSLPPWRLGILLLQHTCTRSWLRWMA